MDSAYTEEIQTRRNLEDEKICRLVKRHKKKRAEKKSHTQIVVNTFVKPLGFDFPKRVHLRDTISYAQALKCGGVDPRHGHTCASDSKQILIGWDGRKAKEKQLGRQLVERVVDFVYDDDQL